MLLIDTIRQAFQTLFAEPNQEDTEISEFEQNYSDYDYPDEDAYVIAMMHWHGYYF